MVLLTYYSVEQGSCNKVINTFMLPLNSSTKVAVYQWDPIQPDLTENWVSVRCRLAAISKIFSGLNISAELYCTVCDAKKSVGHDQQ